MEFSAGKPFQECLAKRMKDHPNLLFGRMVKSDDIQALVLRSRDYWEARGYSRSELDNLEFVSGDYESATDNINPQTSEIIDLFCFRLGLLPDFNLVEGLDYPVIWSVMAKIYSFMKIEGPNCTKNNWVSLSHWIMCLMRKTPGRRIKVSKYRQNLWANRRVQIDKDRTVVQTYGQMMGDIKSFPVLCLLNLSLWYDSCENRCVMLKSSSGHYKSQPPCLVNGDDFLAYAPRSVINTYIKKTKEFDFTLSLGKTYINPRLAVINSRPFYLRKKDLSVSNIELKLVNLCMNQDISLPMVGNLDQVTDLRNPEDVGEMFGLFMKFNKSRVNEETRDGLLGLFVSRELGGLGATLREGIRTKVTRQQMIIATDCKERLSIGLRPRFSAQYIWKILNKRLNTKTGQIGTHEGTGLGIVKIHNQNTTDPEMGILKSYNCSRATRELIRDDWIAKISRTKFTGRGYFSCKTKTQKFRNIIRERKFHFNETIHKDIFTYVRTYEAGERYKSLVLHDDGFATQDSLDSDRHGFVISRKRVLFPSETNSRGIGLITIQSCD